MFLFVFIFTALNIDDRTGSLEIDKEFDALLIDVKSPTSHIDIFDRVSKGDTWMI